MRQTTKREVVAKKLRNSPAAKRAMPQGQSPKKAVKAVQDELVALLARGYSIEEVGRAMSGAGIEISATTLRSYARAANVANTTSTKRRATEPPAAASEPKSEKKKAAAKRKSVTPPAPAARTKSVPPSASKSRAGTKSPAPATGSFHDYGKLGKATFVVRPDTPDSDL